MLVIKLSGRASQVFHLINLMATTRGKTTLGDLKKGEHPCLVLSLSKSRRS
ncbi:MAG TPA: hypothetical protein G4O10_08745 [Dehalococcoidia bacterium]|nr:hypothetical protein [Dehalococcoidia bacterium]